MIVIALIGIDGCGKTTQAKMLSDKLNNEGYDVLYMRPVLSFFNLPILSRILKNSCFSPRISATKEFSKSEKEYNHKKRSFLKKYFFYFSGYPYALFSYLLIRLISINNIVICDRFFYQFFYDIYSKHSLMICKFFPRPDLTFFLDIHPEIAYSRMASEYDKTIKSEYYSSVTKYYNNLVQLYDFNKIDANMSLIELNEKLSLDVIQFMSKKEISKR